MPDPRTITDPAAGVPPVRRVRGGARAAVPGTPAPPGSPGHHGGAGATTRPAAKRSPQPGAVPPPLPACDLAAGEPDPGPAAASSRAAAGPGSSPVRGVPDASAPLTGSSLLSGAGWRAAVKAEQARQAAARRRRGARGPAAPKRAAAPSSVPPAAVQGGIRLTGAAHCIGSCDWAETGTAADVDRASDRHTRTTGHPTAVIAEPDGAS